MKKWLSVAAVVVLCLALVIGVACGGDGGEEEYEKRAGRGAVKVWSSNPAPLL